MIAETTFAGAPALVLSNPTAEIVVPLSFGPRVMHAGRVGEPNLLFAVPDDAPPVSEEVPGYRIRGGHRLWHAPEHPVRTYQPDNDALVWSVEGAEAVVTAPVEAATGIRKSWRVEARATSFVIEHRLANEGLWAVACAPWALTLFPRGGVGVVPLPAAGRHPRDLLPEWSLVPWTYTDFAHPAWRFLPGAVVLDTRAADRPQKLGLTAWGGWCACWQEGGVLVKRVRGSAPAGAVYPDRGCVFETFCNDAILELETLGPLVDLAPGAAVTHTEEWGLLPAGPCPDTAAALASGLQPAVEAWLAGLAAPGS